MKKGVNLTVYNITKNKAYVELERVIMNSLEKFQEIMKLNVKTQYTEDIEKDLKALEIIKEHYVRLDLIHIYKTVEEYNNYIYNDRDSLYNGVEKITKDQFDLLKECLK